MNGILEWLSWIGMACWVICFWWMHRISGRQDSMLKELQDVTQRIESLSKAEHDLIKDLHPRVGEISDKVETVVTAVEAGSPHHPKK